MHIDARKLPDDTQIEGDICIVGAGAAGISMAMEWTGRKERVILLEGGGFSVDSEIQSLNKGKNLGQRYYPLQSSRLRFFGGTTAHWAGYCAILDPIDFEIRDWVSLSGWPIERTELDPFYERVHKILELGPYEYDPDYWEREKEAYVQLPFEETKLQTKMWQFSPPTRFGTSYQDEIVNAENVHLFTYANACNIEANENVSNVQQIQVRTLEGKSHWVKANNYILACGAIQNARLLLASNSQAEKGLGNEHDWVGRCFMDHLEVYTGHLFLPQPAPLDMYMHEVFETNARGELKVAEELQRENKLLNCSISLGPSPEDEQPEPWIEKFPDEASKTVQLWKDLEKAYEAGQIPPIDPSGHTEYLLFTRSEQQPNPDSRIILSGEKDSLGVPRADLNWQLTPLDKQSIRQSYEILANEVGRIGLGRVKLMDWLYEDDNIWPSSLGGGWHHMGTTRMSENPNDGVVDTDCKIHGINNLFVAGSGTFPTSGVANPTLTLVALTLRLSDHLKSLA